MAEYVDKGLKRFGVSISKPILAAICIVAGILIILHPSLLAWTVGLLLVIQGALLLIERFEKEKLRTETTAKGIYCRYCGAGSVEGSVFCKACGKELALAPEPVILPTQENVE